MVYTGQYRVQKLKGWLKALIGMPRSLVWNRTQALEIPIFLVLVAQTEAASSGCNLEEEKGSH